jgi:hypothetical protein
MAKKKNRTLHPDEPLLHPDHARPVTRRDFIRQGFISGAGTVLAPSIFGLLGSNPAHALSTDLEALKLPADCDISTTGGGKIPFICFDLAGGANFAGSNVLVGGPGGAQDLLTSAGYSKMGIPGDRLPNFADPDPVTGFVNRSLGLPFHNESSMLAGILENFTTPTNVNGAVIPARSDNDTGNNPHNPMYGIHKAGANGELMALIGSRNSVSGGNSMSPAAMIDLTVRPTKIDRQSDVKGLVDTGELVNRMGKENATRVMEAIQRISAAKMGKVNIDPGATPEVDEIGITKQVNCGYVQSADLVERYGDPAALDVDVDTDIDAAFGGAGNYLTDGEFRKTASVMKMVVNGYAGAGTITMGGYDYHTGNRTTGDARDLRAGQCIGACLEYAKLKGKPLMIYVCSDGSVASNGTPDASANGKLVWTGDNSSTACSFFLVYNPGGTPQLFNGDSLTSEQHQQLGWYRPDASVETAATPAANNVNLLVETVILNYIALHGDIDGSDHISTFLSTFSNQNLGSATNTAMMERLTAFNGLAGMVNGKIA